VNALGNATRVSVKQKPTLRDWATILPLSSRRSS
jgi:hypothetical protein